MRKSLSVLVVIFTTLLPGWGAPRNVILMIGDGMSIPQRMTAEEFSLKTTGKGLVMNAMTSQALTRTASADSLITDSAASATAIACGEKTLNHWLGLSPKRKRLESCAEFAHKTGRKVGIVTTVTINHATPAGFYAHRDNRGDGYGIGLDLLESKFDFFAGGGLDGHNDKKHREYRGDIYELAAKAGWKFSKYDRKQFDSWTRSSLPCWYAACRGTLPYSIDRKGDEETPTLAEMTSKAIDLLSGDRKGFFLMVEGGKIDYAGHSNDAATNLREVLAFDEAVRVAIKFARGRSDTLVVVTGDHETGGLTMGFAATGYNYNMERLAVQKCSGDEFVRRMREARPKDFDEAKKIISEHFGLAFESDPSTKTAGAPVVSASEENMLRCAFAHDMELARAGKKDDERYDANKITRLPAAVKELLAHKSGIGWTSGAHTALPVLTSAYGEGANVFTGIIENTDIAKKLKALLK